MARIFLATALLCLSLQDVVVQAGVFFRTKKAVAPGSLASSDEYVVDKKKRGNIYKTLEKESLALFHGMHRYPVAMKKDRGNIQVRSFSRDNEMITLSEVKYVGVPPNEFIPFLQNFCKEFSKVNPMAKSTKVLEKDGRDREAVKSVLKFPFPLSNRIMIHWKYLRLNRQPNEHMLVLSERGNDQLVKRYFTKQDSEKYVLARTFLCAYWIRPIYNENNKVVGSNVRYLFSGDTGGAIPRKMQNFVGTKAAFDSVHELIRHVKKRS